MKAFVFGLALAATSASASAGDVAVSISLGERGFYGQIDIGGVPPPQLVYTQPVVIERAPEYRAVAPVYLHVPPGHEKHWSKHCREYNACGRPVYFVRDDWYQKEYVPHYRHGDHDRDEDHDHGRHRGDHKDRDRDDRRD